MPNLDVPTTLWSAILSRAGRKGLQETGNVRHFERLRFHCETAVVEDAIDRVFDSGLVLDPKVPWKPEDLLLVEPHLYGTTEHAAFVLGLLGHQYENPIGQSFEQWLKGSLLKQQVVDARIRPRMVDPALDPKEAVNQSYYYVQKFDHTLNTGSDWDRAHAVQKTELVRRLAAMAHKQMNPKPNLDELEHAIKTLMSLELEVCRKDNDHTGDGASVFKPALTFTRDGDVMVAEQLIDNISKTKLKDCVQEVLCHEFTHPKNIVYGASRGPIPYAWSVLRIMPKKDVRIQMDNGLFFSKEVVERTREALQGVDAASKSAQHDPHALQPIDLQPARFESHFSRTPHSVVNMDLDEWAADKQAARIGLPYLYDDPPLDAPDWSTAPHHFTEVVLEQHEQNDGKALKPYPSCFPELEPLVCKAMVEEDKVDNPEKYSLRASCTIVGVKRPREVQEEAEESKSQADEEMRGADVSEKRRYDPACFTDDVDQEDSDDLDDYVFPDPKRAKVDSAAAAAHQPPQGGYNAFPFVVSVNGAARFTAQQVAEADRMRN
jgi:hypothetical protein